MSNDLIFRIALTKVPHIGHVHAKQLLRQIHDAEKIFSTHRSQLEKIEGIGRVRAEAIRKFKDFSECEREIRFIQKYKIQVYNFQSPLYPQRLLQCHDGPSLLYSKGDIDLNGSKFISIVGTRNNTVYGKNICEQLISQLSTYKPVIISGLAYGIDSIAHRSALKNNLYTMAVLAHGLDRIYPAVNTKLSEEISKQGCLLSDFPSNTNPDKQNFPSRNRITAGICDALVIVETGKSGGSQITAEIANSYNRDVFAFPGRTTDSKSEGCLELIKSNKAALISSAEDLIGALGWKSTENKQKTTQRELFISMNEEERKLTELLEEKGVLDIDSLCLLSEMSCSRIANALLQLEIKGCIQTLPGKKYKLA